jgi:hypothetical protein
MTDYNKTEAILMSAKNSLISAVVLAAAVLSGPALGAQSQEERKLNELRNTVVNLLQALVERGVMTREQAEGLVNKAQEKAAADAALAQAQSAAQEAAEAGAVRVPYIPEVVKEEIRKQVAADLAPQVAQNVMDQARVDGWPGALPDWIRRVRWSGDMRLRGQSDMFEDDNYGGFFDFQAINDAGGIAKAGLKSLRNTSEDRYRLRARLRLGLDAELGRGWTVGTRLTSGNLRDPVSTNQTLGNTGQRYQTDIDLAYAAWSGTSSDQRNTAMFSGGRIPNPWQSYDLVWDPDLTFEGVTAGYRRGFTRDARSTHFVYATVGAFPLQEVELSKDDKWLYGAQLGTDWRFDGGSRLRAGVAYYYFSNIAGQRNTLDSALLDYTAPQFLQTGNTLFDIRNSTSNDLNLFALASDFHLVDGSVGMDWQVSPDYRVSLQGEYVKNIGYDRAKMLARSGIDIEPRDTGYLAELSFGAVQMARPGAWRVSMGYRYLESDATLDAFADSDFHLGGTNTKGYIITADVSLSERVFGRLRYLSANELDGNQLGVDVLQLDLNASF